VVFFFPKDREGVRVPKRVKKPPVSPEVARNWFRRHQEGGESASQIAKTDGFDVRTVGRRLDLVRQEGEVREARQVVLRQALQEHYRDLCSLAERIRAQLAGQTPVDISSGFEDDPMWKALRDHLPRSPLWTQLDRLEKLAHQFAKSTNELKEHIKREAQSTLSFAFIPSTGGIGLSEGIVEGTLFHVVSLAQGGKGLRDMEFTRAKTDFGVNIQRGAFGIATAPEERVSNLETSCAGLMNKAVEWEESSKVFGQIQEFKRVQRDLREELTKIILRRVLPGHCAYCPF
jgi:hypothetical protein